MSETTQRLKLPYIMPSQAMKHVTDNEALQRIDAAVHLTIDLTIALPVEIPSAGMTCLIDEDPSGDWTGQAGKIAFWQDDSWQFTTPLDGWLAWFKSDEKLRLRHEGSWADLPLPDDAQFDQLGIGATPDATNRFALSSDASLLTHGASGGHQLKINKETAGDTASLLFQSGWTGHAEMGLAGNNDFSIKQSPDGSNWFSALTLSGNGVAGFPSRPMVKASHTAINIAATSSTQSGFSIISMAQGGFTLGATISGTMRELNVPVSGNYLALLHLVIASASAVHGANIRVNGTQRGNAIEAPASTTSHSHTLLNLMQLNAGDKISIGHNGTSTIAFGPDKTELTLLHIG
jgi:hypothetical protein